MQYGWLRRAGSQSEVGGRVCLPPVPDQVQICRGVMESMATVASWNQRHLRTRCQREDVEAGRCVGEWSGEVSTGSVCFGMELGRPTMTDDDSAPLFAILGRAEISRL
jgi:hypothetical protein